MNKDKPEFNPQLDLNVLPLIFDQIQAAVLITDEHSKIIYINQAYIKMSGYNQQELLGQNPGLTRSGYHDEAFYKRIWDSIIKTDAWQGEIWNRNKAGEVYPVLLSISKVVNLLEQGTIYIAISSDLSYLNIQDHSMIQNKVFDTLTSLPSLKAMYKYFDKVIQAFTQRGPTVKSSLAIIYINLEKFKNINELYGFVIGDKLLAAVGKRFRDLISDHNIIARYKGDQFIALVPDLDFNTELKSYCTMLKNSFSKPFSIEGMNIYLSCNLGVSVYPDDGKDLDSLIDKAIAAYSK